MTSRKIQEVAADIDDAFTVVEELQAEPDVDTRDKLDELHDTLERASDTIDDVNNKYDKDGKHRGS
jgi:hypothetical protein